jgi:hypothetical protein
MSERDWESLWKLIGNPEANSLALTMESDSKRAEIVVIADREPAQVCPFWDDLRNSGRVRSILGLDEIAQVVSGISENHPGNLITAFPMPRELDRYLAVGAILGISSCVALCVATFRDAKKFEGIQAESDLRISTQRKLLENFESNRREIVAIQAQMPDISNAIVADPYAEIIALEAAIPNALLLQSLIMADDGGFDIEALAIGPGFDSDNMRRTFSEYGFVPGSPKGWLYDAASGTLKIRGKFGSHIP